MFQIAKRQFDERMAVLQSGVNRIRSDSLSQSVNNLNNRVSLHISYEDSKKNFCNLANVDSEYFKWVVNFCCLFCVHIVFDRLLSFV